jgi:succinate-acetate transporter protein
VLAVGRDRHVVGAVAVDRRAPDDPLGPQVDRHDVGEARPRDIQNATVVRREHVVDELVVTLANQLADREEVAVALRIRLDLLHPLVDVRDDVDAGDAAELARLDDVGRPVPVVAHVEDAARGGCLSRRGGGDARRQRGEDRGSEHCEQDSTHRQRPYPLGWLPMRAYPPGTGVWTYEVYAATRVTLRPIGNPLPLGFLALAGATLLVSGLQLGWLSDSDGGDVALILIAFVFPLQLVTSVFGYLGRDVVAGTGMGILSGTWLSVGLVTLTSPAGSTSDALGLFLLVAAVAMLVPALAALNGKLVAVAVLGTTALRFACTGLYELTVSDTWKDIAGVVGLALCAIAIYAALAIALEDSRRRTVLPTGRRGAGRDVEDEAGIRAQL